MARQRKRSDLNPDGTKMDKKSQKCGLKSILREQYHETFIEQVKLWCHTATQICVLGSSLFLFEVNSHCDNDVHYFNQSNALGRQLINQCFDRVLRANCNTLPDQFLQIAYDADPEFRYLEAWPERGAINNALNQLKTQYVTNVRNNLVVHCFTRVKQFFILKQHEYNEQLQDNPAARITDLDVRQATKELVLGTAVRNPGANVDALLDEAYLIGIPHDRPFKNYISDNWFRSLPIFVNIQRQITGYHRRYEDLNNVWREYRKQPTRYPMPTIPQPPKVTNFRAVPVHNAHMKNIRIDSHLMYELSCKLGAFKLWRGIFSRQPINISRTEYESDLARYWNYLFDMHKIEYIADRKQFDFAIVTDSVSVSLQFLDPKREIEREISDAQIAADWLAGKIDFGLGMDTGVRTWNAVDRLHFHTHTEVRNCMNNAIH